MTQNEPGQRIKFEHTVGSHSDDRGGDSDIRCTCQDDYNDTKPQTVRVEMVDYTPVERVLDKSRPTVFMLIASLVI